MHGHYMSIVMRNPGNAAIGIQWLRLFGSPRTLNVSDWRQNIAQEGVQDHTLNQLPQTIIAGNGYDNTLVDPGELTPFSQTGVQFIPMNLYSGPINWFLQIAGGGTTVASGEICDIGTAGGLSGNLNNGNTGKIQQLLTASTTGGVFSGSCLLPRSACAIFLNVTVVGSGSYYFKAVAQQGP